MPARWKSVLLEHPHLVHALYLAASEVVNDFEDYGSVLQANEHGEYDEATAIGRLKRVRNEILEEFERRHV
jgi:hypothetical protein